MLSSIRKFSTSIYAKILLGIVAIPFIFWGMGTSFSGGNKNVVVVIDKQKYSTKEFANFVSSNVANEKISSEKIDEFLSVFIGNKLMEKEFEYFNINLSDKSLSKLIKIQEGFKEDGKFSRTKYEKFLISNNYNAVSFEKSLGEQEKRKHLLNFIGGGIVPSNFMVNKIFNGIEQKRKIELINLNDIYKNITFTENEIKSYYENNKNKFIDTFKAVKILEINPKNLIGSDNYSDVFFKKLDEIQDLIIQGKKLDSITNDYNLTDPKIFKINKLGKNLDNSEINNISEEIVNKIFLLSPDDPVTFIEEKDKFYVLEVFETKDIQKDLNDKNVLKNIKNNLISIEKGKLISDLMLKINQKKFFKIDFDNFSKNNNVKIQKITLDNLDDTKLLKTNAVNRIYNFPEKKITLIFDNTEFTESFLVYIDKVISVSIDENSKDYKKYFRLSKGNIANDLFNTYDNYIKGKYDIDINYKALKTIKNYFN